ncbi:MAG: UDP-N-acetylglucosamine 2-epimerase (non-hydrolyzing) [Burkholderiaceae bacterium]
MTILTLVAGTRPNFTKVAPLIRALERTQGALQYRLVHTGQHYDRTMNDVFFEELGIPQPHVNLACGGGSHAEQTGRIMVQFEREIQANRPDWVIVVGDVNSTLACSIVARKMGVRVAHVEAGLRSGDMTMPEEINRLVTDSISDLFFATEQSACANLAREGKPAERVHFVGHVMVDNLFYQAKILDKTDVSAFPTESLKRELLGSAGRYGVVTLHRPANVDAADTFEAILGALAELAEGLPLVWPVHPRTRKRMVEGGLAVPKGLILTDPLPYMEFLNLWRDAAIVLTDSGGLQEETTALGVRCVTIRDTTERPVTIDQGTNVLAGLDRGRIVRLATEAMSREPRSSRPPLWDGRSAERIVDVLLGNA